MGFSIRTHPASLGYSRDELGPALHFPRQARFMLAEAEPLFRRALMGRQMKLGPKHPDTLEVMNNLAKLLQAVDGQRMSEIKLSGYLNYRFK